VLNRRLEPKRFINSYGTMPRLETLGHASDLTDQQDTDAQFRWRFITDRLVGQARRQAMRSEVTGLIDGGNDDPTVSGRRSLFINPQLFRRQDGWCSRMSK